MWYSVDNIKLVFFFLATQSFRGKDEGGALSIGRECSLCIIKYQQQCKAEQIATYRFLFLHLKAIQNATDNIKNYACFFKRVSQPLNICEAIKIHICLPFHKGILGIFFWKDCCFQNLSSISTIPRIWIPFQEYEKNTALV